MKKISLFINLTGVILILTSQLFTQVTQEWVSRYNGTGSLNDYAVSIAVDGLGNVYVTGYSTGSGTGNDFATIKYNSSGVQQWAARYSGTGNYPDEAVSIAVDGSGNVFVTGYSYGVLNWEDYLTIKYNSSGVQEWVQIYNGPVNGTDKAVSISLDGFGNTYVTGWSDGGGSHGPDYATIKYNTSGVQQWIQRYNGPGNTVDYAYAIAVDSLGTIYVTGSSANISLNSDFTTIKYNTSGVQQWVARYNGTDNKNDESFSIALDVSGNVYVTGYTRSGETEETNDYATIKYNTAGIQQWVAKYNGPGNNLDKANSVKADGSGNVYVTGYSRSDTIFGTEDYATIKYNNSGVQQWVQRYNGAGNMSDEAFSLAIDNAGSIYVTGEGNGLLNSDYTTIKYNPSGDEIWVKMYDGPGTQSDRAAKLIVDSAGNLFVTGVSWGGSAASNDFATIKYSQQIGIQQISTEIPETYSLSQNYPNPFNPTTKIRFAIPHLLGAQYIEPVQLKVYDILGREVAVLVNEYLMPGTYEVNWNAGNFSSGVYYYMLKSGKYINANKMILLK